MGERLLSLIYLLFHNDVIKISTCSSESRVHYLFMSQPADAEWTMNSVQVALEQINEFRLPPFEFDENIKAPPR